MVLTRKIVPLLHPSQTVLNLFREPQGAVQSVQATLDQMLPCAVLSLDLSKAFERVNPHWIIQILTACKAPLWVIVIHPPHPPLPTESSQFFFPSGTADVALRLGPKIGVNLSNELKISQ
jgi:hypothetical protein